VQNLKVPTLRERADDIPELARHFLQRFCSENGLADVSFSAPALEALKQHSWPGNIRELANVVQRCALNAASPSISKAEVVEHGRLAL
jgi:two-component system, NtrC family, response regulator GlrR